MNHKDRLIRRIAYLEDRVLNAANVEAAARFHAELDRVRDELERLDPCAERISAALVQWAARNVPRIES